MAVEAPVPCGDCNNNNNNNNNIVILIKIITDENLTLTKRLIKKIVLTFKKTVLILPFTIKSVVPLPFSHVLNNR
jgi:hypothetical protein